MEAAQSQVVDVATCPDWELVCYTNAPSYQTDLPQQLQNRILRRVWETQDGYGTPGYTPPQGWDWSGIRDSSAGARAHCAGVIRLILRGAGVTTFTVSSAS